MGRRPTRGRATLSAAKIENASSAWPSHGRGPTSRRYHGSTAVKSAPPATATRKKTLREPSVVAA